MRGLKLLGVTAIFVGGWVAATLTNRFARAEAPKPTAATTAESTSGQCIDHEAMTANANLVGQLHDSKSRVSRAEEDAAAARARAGAQSALSVNGAHPRLETSAEDWGRMAKDNTVRLRLPCSSWSDPGIFSVLTGRPHARMGASHRQFEMNNRAELAGFSDEERETLNAVYKRTHERTWAAMRATCEANAAYQDSLRETKESMQDDVDSVSSTIDDETRVQLCRTSVVDLSSATARTAVTRVAELRAAGYGIDKAENDEQRVMHALTTSSANLYDEMLKSFGKEKTTRALDNGVMCTNEVVYDTRPPPPPPPPITIDETDDPSNERM